MGHSIAVVQLVCDIIDRVRMGYRRIKTMFCSYIVYLIAKEFKKLYKLLIWERPVTHH